MTRDERPKSPEEIAALVAKHGAEADKFRAEAAWFASQAREKAVYAEKLEHDFMLVRRSFDREQRDNDENRIIDFTNSVDRASAEACMNTLARWRRESKDQIVIRFSSPGGSVIDGLSLFDYIQSVRADGIRVVTCTLGYAASMACILLQAGTERVMGANSHILIHEVSSGAIGKLSEMEDETKFVRRLNDRLVGILAAKAKMSRAAIKNRAKRKDWWVSADEALKIGFCDRLGYA